MAKTVEFPDGTHLEVSNSRARRLIENGDAKPCECDSREEEPETATTSAPETTAARTSRGRKKS